MVDFNVDRRVAMRCSGCGPRVFETRGLVKDQGLGLAIEPVGHKIPQSLELIRLTRQGFDERGLHHGVYLRQAVRIQTAQTVLSPSIGLSLREEAVIDAHHSWQRIHGTHPRDHSLDLHGVGAWGATFGIRDELGVHTNDLARLVDIGPQALDHVSVFETNFIARKESEKTFRRLEFEITALNPKLG